MVTSIGPETMDPWHSPVESFQAIPEMAHPSSTPSRGRARLHRNLLAASQCSDALLDVGIFHRTWTSRPCELQRVQPFQDDVRSRLHLGQPVGMQHGLSCLVADDASLATMARLLLAVPLPHPAHRFTGHLLALGEADDLRRRTRSTHRGVDRHRFVHCL